MSNDIVDLTDQFNELILEYMGYGDQVVDFDCWAVSDILRLADLVACGAALAVVQRTPNTEDDSDEYYERD
jgi:hypothetical protein